MTKNEFKIGDVVRVKDSPQTEKEFNLPPLPDYLFRVEHIQDGKLTVVPGCSDVRFIVDVEHFELAETSDRNTAFLRELQALLRKYDAKIESCAEGTEDSWIDIYIGDECVICFDRNPQTCCATITADNIMDYDKE